MDETPYRTRVKTILRRRSGVRYSARPMGTLRRCGLLYLMAINGAAIGAAAQGSGHPYGLAAGGLVGLAMAVVFLLVVDWRPKP